ncbi:hypothetical protein HDU80_001178 [Chytriomyces hyalinus]|nr:hypothetical protein HDU80_001178 [Chytriomyces hyalinus]
MPAEPAADSPASTSAKTDTTGTPSTTALSKRPTTDDDAAIAAAKLSNLDSAYHTMVAASTTTNNTWLSKDLESLIHYTIKAKDMDSFTMWNQAQVLVDCCWEANLDSKLTRSCVATTIGRACNVTDIDPKMLHRIQ